MQKDTIVITTKNACDEVLRAKLDNPTCSDIVVTMVSSAKFLGFGNMQLYIALMEQCDKLAEKIIHK